MDDYGYYRRWEIPAFGSWESYDGLPFTQCFDTAASRQGAPAGLLRYSYAHDRDLYVAGDLYANDVITPTMIVVPRRRQRATKVRVDDDGDAKGESKEKEAGQWPVGDFGEPLSPMAAFQTRPTPKPVDADLYKIPPEFLYAKSKKKRGGLNFFRCCLMPEHAM